MKNILNNSAFVTDMNKKIESSKDFAGSGGCYKLSRSSLCFLLFSVFLTIICLLVNTKIAHILCIPVAGSVNVLNPHFV